MLPQNLFWSMCLAFVILALIVSLISLSFRAEKKKMQAFVEIKKNSNWFNKWFSLFLSFDPESSFKLPFLKELNWLILIFLITLSFYQFFFLSSRVHNIMMLLLMNLKEQFSISLKTKKDGSSLLFLSIFFMFLNCNIFGLIPNVFTASSHLTFNLFFSLSLWVGFFLFGWICYTNKMFAHLVPLSTPNVLISFMVLIESISTIIRPGTLAIRLMANMVSGHLLLTLMGNSMVLKPFLMVLFLVLVQSLLSLLEISVGFIQAYVFCMLLSLYSDESDYMKLN